MERDAVGKNQRDLTWVIYERPLSTCACQYVAFASLGFSRDLKLAHTIYTKLCQLLQLQLILQYIQYNSLSGHRGRVV